MSKTLKLNKFAGMVTDIDAVRQPDNTFREIINLRLARDNSLQKIPGFMSWLSYAFDSTIRELVQIKKIEGDQTFVLTKKNIYKIDEDKNVLLLKQDYPLIQTGFPNIELDDVESEIYADKAWCVDKNVFPFVIYNVSDETGINLNVPAKLIVDPTNPTDTLLIVNFNDITDIYDTITLVPIDGTNLTIRYNDGNDIYIFSDTYAYKFDYGSTIYGITATALVSPSAIQEISFKPDVFGIRHSGNTFLRYNYNFVETTDEVKQLWKKMFNEVSSGYESTADFGLQLRKEFLTSSSTWLLTWETYDVDAYLYELLYSSMSMTSLKDAIDIDLNIPEKTELFQYGDPSLTNTIFQKSFPSTVDLGGYGMSINGHMIFKISNKVMKIIMFTVDNKLYVGQSVSVDYSLYYDVIYSENYSGSTGHETGTPLNQAGTKYVEQVSVFDLDNDLTPEANTITIADLETMLTNNEETVNLYNVEDISASEETLINQQIQLDLVMASSIPTQEVFSSATGSFLYDSIETTDPLFIDTFGTKRPYINQESFSPYITEYNSNDWEVQMLGTPGRPVGTIANPGAGSLTGTYRFYTAYETTQKGTSETYKSQPSEEIVLNSDDVTVTWAIIPTQYFEYNYLGIRIYVEDMSTNITTLLAIVANPSADWTAGFKTFSALTPIINVLETVPYYPKMKLIDIHLERLVMGGSTEAPNTLYYSEVQDPASAQLTNFVILKEKDGDFITGFKSIYDRLIVFKNNHIYAVVGDLANPQGVLTVTEKYGCISTRSILVYKNTLMFYSYAGLCMLEGNKVIELSRDVINKWINENFTEEELKASFAEFDIITKTYRLFVKDRVIVFDFKGGFYIEDKLDPGEAYGTVAITSDSEEKRHMLFSIDNAIYEDFLGISFNGRKRGVRLRTKSYKLTELNEKTILGLIRLNANLNSLVLLVGDKDVSTLVPDIKNYYEERIDDICGKDVAFQLTEESFEELQIYEIELEYD